MSRKLHSSELPVPHLRRWRLFNVMSQQELAQKAGLLSETVLGIEHGRPARFSTIDRLARALGTTRRELVYSLPSLPEPEKACV